MLSLPGMLTDAELRKAARAQAEVRVFRAGEREAEADADAEFVLDLSHRLGIAAEVLHVGSDHATQLEGRSREEGARKVRYELLIEAAHARSCTVIAVGHTADDQVETVLHHILRGTGLAGLAR